MSALKTLKALALAATPGEWRVVGSDNATPHIHHMHGEDWTDINDLQSRVCVMPAEITQRFNAWPNASFISAANPAAILALIERLEAAEAAPLPAEQPSNPVPLTDAEIDEIASTCNMYKYQYENDPGAYCLMFAREIEARIVGQQTKGGGNV